jgi:hypothetical protein
MLPLEVPIAAISSLRGQLISARDTLEDGDFESIGGPMTEFGTFDNRGLLQHHHGLAHGLMLTTIKTHIGSLDQFYDALVSLQAAMDQTDGNAAQDVKTINTALADLDAASHLPGTERERDHYRHEHDPHVEG